MTPVESVTAYGLQFAMTDALSKKLSRTTSGVIEDVAVAYMAATDSESSAAVQKVDNFARALIYLTTNTYGDCNLTAKTSTNEALAMVE